MTTTLPAGTRIEVEVFHMDGTRSYEPARILPRFDEYHLPVGYHPVRYDADGQTRMVHERGFRVVDNRA